MTLLDPAERTDTGVQAQTELLAAPAPEPRTLFESSWRDYIFAEVWTRPGLDRRSRYLICHLRRDLRGHAGRDARWLHPRCTDARRADARRTA